MVTRDLFAPDALAGSSILITGGGTGLGRAMATVFAAHGARVHLWGRRESKLSETAAEIGANAHLQVVDVRDADQVDAAMQTIWTDHGPLTGVVNNAGANFIAPTTSLSTRAFEAVTSTIMKGAFHVTTAAGRRWIADGLPGSVVSILTSWVWSGSAYVVPAAMAKSAVHAMTLSLAVEWAPHGIRVNAVAPGPVPTEFAWDVLDAEASGPPVATDQAGVPAGRYGTPEEVADLVLFLLSGACGYLTGETVAMDGGQRLAGPGTFAGLNTLTEADWAAIRDRAKAAAAASKGEQIPTS